MPLGAVFGQWQARREPVAQRAPVRGRGASGRDAQRLDAVDAIQHGAHPVLTWMASNLMWEKDAADNWKPSKKKSREKIDGMTALIMALGVALAIPPSGPSIEDALLSGDGVSA